MNPLILLTNDDGIHSPGLAAAAQALDPLGDLLIVAPVEQQTSMSRSRTQQCGGDGTISRTTVQSDDANWEGFSVNATPAVTVVHALTELANRPVSLVVSGINYGENVASCVTVSGTIGAAIEAAEKGLPTLAVSQEIASQDYHNYSTEVDFSAAGYFTRQIAEKILAGSMPFDVDVLKLEVPLGATQETRCVVTRQDRYMYYQPVIQHRDSLIGTKSKVSYVPNKGHFTAKDTDAYALAQGWVSVTPLSFDLTSRTQLDKLAGLLGTSLPEKEE